MKWMFAFLTAIALPAVAASPLKSIPQSCTALRKDGWTAPADPFSGKKGQAEMNIPGVMYVCMIEHVLARAAGTGHPPDLQALMSDDGSEPSIILSAHIWCETDLPATLDALTKAFTLVNGSPLPEAIATALHAAKPAKVTLNGLVYEVSHVDVDATACTDVPAGKLGPVLMEVSVSVKGAK
jgi:hypothetical protein